MRGTTRVAAVGRTNRSIRRTVVVHINTDPVLTWVITVVGVVYEGRRVDTGHCRWNVFGNHARMIFLVYGSAARIRSSSVVSISILTRHSCFCRSPELSRIPRTRQRSSSAGEWFQSAPRLAGCSYARD